MKWMLEKMNILEDEIKKLIATRREDEWWDFKEYHHEDKGALLHDIICLANNRANRDAYLIFGVQDQTYKIVGIENDHNRKNQQNIVDFLRSKPFVGQIRPRVEVQTITLDFHEIDVFIIKDSTDVPYYLINDYSDKDFAKNNHGKSKLVRANYIYTRVIDTNTPIDQNADLRDVEYLWKKRFGLTQTALEQVKVLLKSHDEWIYGGEEYYNSLFPQFRIVEEYQHDGHDENKLFTGNFEYFHSLFRNNSCSQGILIVSCYSTQIYSRQFMCLGHFSILVPTPEIDFYFPNINNTFFRPRYYVKTELYFQIYLFFIECFRKDLGNIIDEYSKTFLDAILVFNTQQEKHKFLEYAKNNLDVLLELVSQEPAPQLLDCVSENEVTIREHLQIARALKKMHLKWYERNGIY